MSGSLSGRSWPWAVSSTMGPASTPAVARVANPVCPQGNAADISSYKHVTNTWKVFDCVCAVFLFVLLFYFEVCVCVEGVMRSHNSLNVKVR